jgi:hypothetical protein
LGKIVADSQHGVKEEFSSYLIKSREKCSDDLSKMLEPSPREYEGRVVRVTLFDELALERAACGSALGPHEFSREDSVLDALPTINALVLTEPVNSRMVGNPSLTELWKGCPLYSQNL